MREADHLDPGEIVALPSMGLPWAFSGHASVGSGTIVPRQRRKPANPAPAPYPARNGWVRIEDIAAARLISIPSLGSSKGSTATLASRRANRNDRLWIRRSVVRVHPAVPDKHLKTRNILSEPNRAPFCYSAQGTTAEPRRHFSWLAPHLRRGGELRGDLTAAASLVGTAAARSRRHCDSGFETLDRCASSPTFERPLAKPPPFEKTSLARVPSWRSPPSRNAHLHCHRILGLTTRRILCQWSLRENVGLGR